MVNFAAFGPLKSAKMSPFGDKSDKVKLIGASEVSDVEANNLLHVAKEDRVKRRLRNWCCLPEFCELLGIAALIAVVLITVFVLYKAYWLKNDIERLKPALEKVKSSVEDLEQTALALQSENQDLYAIVNIYGDEIQNLRGNSTMAPEDDEEDDSEMADTSPEVLRQLKEEETKTTPKQEDIMTPTVESGRDVSVMTILTSPSDNSTNLDLLGFTIDVSDGGRSDEIGDGDSPLSDYAYADLELDSLDASDESTETLKPDKDDTDDGEDDSASSEENDGKEKS